MRGKLAMPGMSVFAVGAAALALALPTGEARAARASPTAGSGARSSRTAALSASRAEAMVAAVATAVLAEFSPSWGSAQRPAHNSASGAKHVQVLSTPPASASRCRGGPPPVPEHPISHRQWLNGVTITEYYPAPERWFVGRRIAAPGLPGRYAADWLYSARGLAMEGDGVDRFGRRDHIAQLGSTGWVNAAGRATAPVCLGEWSNGSPVWLRGGWRNARGAVTFPLAASGWSDGTGVRVLPYGGVTFAPNPSLPLPYYHSVAVDPRLIPLGSRVYVPAYRHIGGGWFIAGDTGGAIKGRHVDVYRPPPASPDDLGRYLTGQRILVIPPGG